MDSVGRGVQTDATTPNNENEEMIVAVNAIYAVA